MRLAIVRVGYNAYYRRESGRRDFPDIPYCIRDGVAVVQQHGQATWTLLDEFGEPQYRRGMQAIIPDRFISIIGDFAFATKGGANDV